MAYNILDMILSIYPHALTVYYCYIFGTKKLVIPDHFLINGDFAYDQTA